MSDQPEDLSENIEVPTPLADDEVTLGEPLPSEATAEDVEHAEQQREVGEDPLLGDITRAPVQDASGLQAALASSRPDLQMGAPLQDVGPRSGPVSIQAVIDSQVEQALYHMHLGEQVHYAAVVTIVPNQQGGPAPVTALTLAIKGPVLNEWVHGTNIIPNLWFADSEMDKIVQDMVSQLQAARSNALAQANGQAGQAQGGPGQP